MKLQNLAQCYIDDLLLASPKSFGIDLHLAVLDFVMKMMCKSGFRVNKKKCNILCENVTFLGVELSASGSNGITLERRNLLANVRTPRSLAELFCRVCQFSYSSNYIPQFNKIVAPLRKVIKDNKFK